MRHRIALLERTPGFMAPLAQTLRSLGREEFDVLVVDSPQLLAERSRGGPPADVIFVQFEGHNPPRACPEIAAIRAAESDVPLVAVAERGDVALAAQVVRAGASDLLVLGDALEERVATLLGKVRKITALIERNRNLREHNKLLLESEEQRYSLVGNCASMRAVRERIERVSSIPRPVLVLGERGTGKELVARAIHRAAGRSPRPFVAVNCAAFPDNLLESELFGHDRGAFTGAERAVSGRFEQAAGGTLFLDEIGHMSMAFQQKILRVVEYGTYTRLGGMQELQSEARIVTATNTNIKAAIRDGRFLPDLYDRLAFEVIELPPLRERRDDIAPLARRFLDDFLREVPGLGPKEIDAEALVALERYAFPGNVRELKHCIERAAYRDDTRVITADDLALPSSGSGPPSSCQGFEQRVAAFERQLLVEALERNQGNQARAAQLLGLEYHQFRYYHQKHFGKGRRGKASGGE